MLSNKEIGQAMQIKLDATLPEYPAFAPGIRRAPDRGYRLTEAQTKLALMNALRYVPEELHETLAPEFLEELKTRGRIYAYRYRPEGRLSGKPIVITADTDYGSRTLMINTANIVKAEVVA